MKTVALIGTRHKYQFGEDATRGAFQNLLENACKEYIVKTIAEEKSVEALSQKHLSQSTCKIVADAMRIQHRYCDPSTQQRKELCIRQEQDIRCEAFFKGLGQEQTEREIRASHEIRERYWLEQILSLDGWPVLFVCGANHMEAFRRMLEESKIHVDIVVWDWEPSR